MRNRLKEIAEDCGGLKYILFRLGVGGRTGLHRQLPKLCAELCEGGEIAVDSLCGSVEKVEIDARPAIDLAQLQRGNDPPGVLARLIGALEAGGGDEGRGGLVHEALDRFQIVRRAAAYQDIFEEDLPTEADARRRLLRQGYVLLDALLGQKEGA